MNCLKEKNKKLKTNNQKMSLRQSMFLVAVVFDNGFIIENLYELLPIVPFTGVTFVKGNPLNYYGIDNAIVSIVPMMKNKNGVKYKIRGIRKNNNIDNVSSGSFGNAIGIDFQTCNKNLHIKICSSKKNKSKFHITGLRSFEMTKEVTLNLIEQIKLTEKAWTPFFKLNYEQRYILITKIIDMVSCSGELLSYYSDELKNRIEHIKDKFGDYTQCIDLMLRYLVEDSSLAEFSGRLFRIASLSTGSYSLFHNQDAIRIINTDIYNGTYNANLEYTNLNASFISDKLSQMGYRSLFCNFGKPEIRVTIPIVNNTFFNGSDSNDERAHVFSIKIGGHIGLFSRALPEEAITIGNHLIDIIISIINSDEYQRSIMGGLFNYGGGIKNNNEQVYQHINSKASLNKQIYNPVFSSANSNYFQQSDYI